MSKRKYSEGKSYKVVAFCLSCFASEEETRMIQVAHKIGKEHNCRVVFFSTLSDFYMGDVNDIGEKRIFDVISVQRFDAIILMSESFKSDKEQVAMVKRATAAGVPVLTIDKALDNTINVRFDYKNSFKQVVKHMIEYHGYRTVNFMAGFKNNLYSDERLEMYKEVLKENNIPIEEERIYYGGFWEEPAKEAMQEMFASPLPFPRAIICANDSMAHGVCACLKEKGYRVPEDVAVSGFDGIILEKYQNPRITTIASNFEGMMETLFTTIEKSITKISTEKTIFVGRKLQIGQSCGCDGEQSIDISTELLRMKYQIYVERRFYDYMNQMVANLGTEKDIRKIVNSIPQHIGLMDYKKLWFCLNEDFVQYMIEGNRIRQDVAIKDTAYTETMRVIKFEQNEEVNLKKSVSFGKLIPHFNKEIEEGDCMMVTPVHLKGETVGYAVATFDEERLSFPLFSNFLINVRYLLEMQRDRVKLESVYMKDSLSGLLNRNGFNNLIAGIMERKIETSMAIISMDMDNLKKINDTHGHAEGDEALHDFGRIIDDVIENEEISARIGGDEFIIVICGEDAATRARQIIEDIRESLDIYNKTSGKDYTLQASMGFFADKVSGNTLDYFIRKADNLMYMDKYLHRKNISDIFF